MSIYFPSIFSVTRKGCRADVAIETVVKNKSQSQASFDLPGCFKQDESKLRILDSEDPVYCSAYCGGGVQACKVLIFNSPEYSDLKCLHINQATTFPTDQPCDPRVLGNGQEYEVADWSDQDHGIQPGLYTLKAQFNVYSYAPEICVYQACTGGEGQCSTSS